MLSRFPLSVSRLRAKKLTFFLETAAQETFLFPCLAREFPQVVEQGGQAAKNVTGVGQSTMVDSIRSVAGKEAETTLPEAPKNVFHQCSYNRHRFFQLDFPAAFCQIQVVRCHDAALHLVFPTLLSRKRIVAHEPVVIGSCRR